MDRAAGSRGLRLLRGHHRRDPVVHELQADDHRSDPPRSGLRATHRLSNQAPQAPTGITTDAFQTGRYVLVVASPAGLTRPCIGGGLTVSRRCPRALTLGIVSGTLWLTRNVDLARQVHQDPRTTAPLTGGLKFHDDVDSDYHADQTPPVPASSRPRPRQAGTSLREVPRPRWTDALVRLRDHAIDRGGRPSDPASEVGARKRVLAGEHQRRVRIAREIEGVRSRGTRG